MKKPPNNAKPSSTQVHESKSSKLTITIPFGSKSKTPTTAPTVKKPSSTPTINEEKKKVLGTKIETKSIPPASPKKPIPTSTKTSQLVKPTPISKQTSNEGSKTSLTSNNKTPLASSNLSTVKNKTNSSQPTSNATNNKDRSGTKRRSKERTIVEIFLFDVLVSKSSTSSSSSVVKPTKINPPSTKINSDDRSHSVPVKKTKPMIKEEMTTKTIASPSTMKIPKISSSNDATSVLSFISLISSHSSSFSGKNQRYPQRKSRRNKSRKKYPSKHRNHRKVLQLKVRRFWLNTENFNSLSLQCPLMFQRNLIQHLRHERFRSNHRKKWWQKRFLLFLQRLGLRRHHHPHHRYSPLFHR